MSGISAQYVDGLEFRIKELGEQVEKLTKERDEALERERNCAIAAPISFRNPRLEISMALSLVITE